MKNYQIFTKQEKWSIIGRVEAAKSKERELAKMNIPKSTYYDWKRNNCETKPKAPHKVWNKTPEAIEAKIVGYRKSGDTLKNSPARILENLERSDGYIISESGVKSVLTRIGMNNMLRPKRRHYHIRPKAEKFLDVVSVDDIEFIRAKPRDTYILNFTDESSYFALESKARDHKTNTYAIIKGLKAIKLRYGKYPKLIRLDNARAHKAIKVAKFCQKNNIKIDFITKGCPEENWPVESWHRNLNQDLIYQHGYETIKEWQKAVDQYRHFHNYTKRLRSDPIKRTPAEIAFAYTTQLTQARLKIKLKRKQQGQTAVQKYINLQTPEMSYLSTLSVSEMCVS